MSNESEGQAPPPERPEDWSGSVKAPQAPDPRYPPLPPFAPYPPYPYSAYPPQPDYPPATPPQQPGMPGPYATDSRYPASPGYPPDPRVYAGTPGGAPSGGAPWPQPGVYPPAPEYYGQPGQPGQPGGWNPWAPPAGQEPWPQAGATYPAPYSAQQLGWPQPQEPAQPGFVTLYVLPAVSALVSMGAYALLFGWQFGVGILLSLLVHEMGHYIVIRAKGLPARLPIFIPLVGAFVSMPRMPSRVRDEAEIGIAGPVAGAIAGFACLLAYQFTGAPVLISLAYFGFLINLLNLIPVSPLDGARVTSAISKWFWLLGLVGVAIGVYYTHNILLVLLGMVGLVQTIRRFGPSGKSRYYDISIGARTYITILYFGLAAALAWGVYALHPLATLARMHF